MTETTVDTDGGTVSAKLRDVLGASGNRELITELEQEGSRRLGSPGLSVQARFRSPCRWPRSRRDTGGRGQAAPRQRSARHCVASSPQRRCPPAGTYVVTVDHLGTAVRSFSAVALLPFPVPDGELPPALSRAVASYEKVRSQHRQAMAHLAGHYERSQAARANDVAELRQAASSGRDFSPQHEADEQVDRARTILTIEGLQAEAVSAEQAVRKVAARVAGQYRQQLATEAEQARQAVTAGVEQVRQGLIELRAIERRSEWIDAASQPVGRVKHLTPDVAGVAEALAVEGLLAGPGQVDIGHYLANQRQGTSGQAFTVDIPPRKTR